MRPSQAVPRIDREAAVVDFVLVSSLVLALFLVVLQVGIVLHVRNVLVAAAQDGARHDADADVVDLDEGRVVAEKVVASSLSARAATAITVRTPELIDVGAGQSAVEVTIDAAVPLVSIFPGLHLRVRGHALREGR